MHRSDHLTSIVGRHGVRPETARRSLVLEPLETRRYSASAIPLSLPSELFQVGQTPAVAMPFADNALSQVSPLSTGLVFGIDLVADAPAPVTPAAARLDTVAPPTGLAVAASTVTAVTPGGPAATVNPETSIPIAAVGIDSFTVYTNANGQKAVFQTTSVHIFYYNHPDPHVEIQLDRGFPAGAYEVNVVFQHDVTHAAIQPGTPFKFTVNSALSNVSFC
jgi:hypothetical protein